jgi:copper chaperone CopZ
MQSGCYDGKSRLLYLDLKREWQMTEFRIDGMTCGGCEQSVKKIMLGIDGVDQADVARAEGGARVIWRPTLSADQREAAARQICDSVSAAGFDCTIR